MERTLRFCFVAALAAVLVVDSAASANVFNMGGTRNADGSWNGAASLETVRVGNPGNAKDPATGNLYGQVNYAYNIGKYEVTAGQYTEFLNTVGGVDTYALYNTEMSNTSDGSGIARSGGGTIGNPYTYTVDANFVNRPVNYVSFWDATRFANWLHNGQPTGAQDASTTEDGAYTLTSSGITNNTITRNTGWQWAVTSEDEWYKAAYYNPATSSYYRYPTSSNTAPGRDMDDISGNNANYYGTPNPIQSPYYTTVAGEFQNSDSPYGTFDQGGNVWEWNEATLYGSYRGTRGGSFYYGYLEMRSWGSREVGATYEYSSIGFRVSQLPEPASMTLLALGGLALLARRR